MNCHHAVDAYFYADTHRFVLLRRRDDSVLVLPDTDDAKLVGHAVASGLDRSLLNGFEWCPLRDDHRVDDEDAAIAVIWREDGQMVVSTPICTDLDNLSDHPRVKLASMPGFAELGEAVKDRLEYFRQSMGL